MRKRLIGPIALAAFAILALAAVAVAEKPTTVQAGNLILTINGKVTPKALPKATLAPISLTAQGKIATADGNHPPALKEVVIDTDKNGTIDARGVPTCKQGQLEAHDDRSGSQDLQGGDRRHRHHRRRGRIPRTKADSDIHSQLTAFNGPGGGKGSATILIHAFLTTPISAAIVTTVKVKKRPSGRYGTRSVALVPKIANGSGSVTAFSLTFPKKLFAYKGKKHGYLLAKCSDGHFAGPGRSLFPDGRKLGPAQIQRACTPKG